MSNFSHTTSPIAPLNRLAINSLDSSFTLNGSSLSLGNYKNSPLNSNYNLINPLHTNYSKLDMPELQSPGTSFSNRKIWVTFSREGIHRYPAAYSDPKLATGDEYDVSFLAHPHRHIFNFKVWVGVTHDDRDIEFIQFKRWLENLYKKETLQLDNKSCEMIADALHLQIKAKYPNRYIKIQVDEDGENGCEVEYL